MEIFLVPISNATMRSRLLNLRRYTKVEVIQAIIIIYFDTIISLIIMLLLLNQSLLMTVPL